MYQLYRDRPLLVLCMIIANIILSGWCLSLDPVINFDGVTYITAAQLFLDGQGSAAYDSYSWPYYSLFIAGTAKILAIDVELAAFVLNTALVISLTLAFVCIVAELSNNNKRIILIAIVLILFFPSISKYRSFVIRDFGYLSCYLWSLYFIFRFCATYDKKHLIGWILFASVSSLFRFEGFIFILIAPYFLFLFSSSSVPHRKKVIAFLSILIAGGATALLLWYVNDKYTDSVEVAKLAGQNIKNFTDLFAANIQKSLGDENLTISSFIGLLIANTGDVSYELIRRMAVFYFLFVIYAYVKRLALSNKLQHRIWQIYVATNLLMLISFSLSNNFIVSRYAMASALTLLILAPFAIDHLLIIARESKLPKRIAIGFTFIVLAGVSIEGLDVGTDKLFVKTAGQWINENLSEDDSLYSNNKLVIYYAKRGSEANLKFLYNMDILRLLMDTGQIKSFDYIALIGNNENFYEKITRQTLSYRFGKAIKILHGENGDFAFIHRVKRKPNDST